jgi:hypothetical protein
MCSHGIGRTVKIFAGGVIKHDKNESLKVPPAGLPDMGWGDSRDGDKTMAWCHRLTSYGVPIALNPGKDKSQCQSFVDSGQLYQILTNKAEQNTVFIMGRNAPKGAKYNQFSELTCARCGTRCTINHAEISSANVRQKNMVSNALASFLLSPDDEVEDVDVQQPEEFS